MPSDNEEEGEPGSPFDTPGGAAAPPSKESAPTVPAGTGAVTTPSGPTGIEGLSASLLAVVQQLQIQSAQQQEQFTALQRAQQDILQRLAPAAGDAPREDARPYLNPLEFLAEIGPGFSVTPGRAAPHKPHLFDLYNDRTADTLADKGRKTALEEYKLLYSTTFYYTAALRALEEALGPSMAAGTESATILEPILNTFRECQNWYLKRLDFIRLTNSGEKDFEGPFIEYCRHRIYGLAHTDGTGSHELREWEQHYLEAKGRAVTAATAKAAAIAATKSSGGGGATKALDIKAAGKRGKGGAGGGAGGSSLVSSHAGSTDTDASSSQPASRRK